MATWTTADIPRQSGKVALVTGANSGVGFYTALELARAGAEVILACRNLSKAKDAVARIHDEVPRARASVASLDLADLRSVRALADKIVKRGKLDLLVNNAGVMALPTRQTTDSGFEMQFGVNHLGHFALTGLLLPALLRAPRPRVVTVSSLSHVATNLNFSDLQAQKCYWPWIAYAQSKLANLMFASELQRRSQATKSRLLSLAAHPGLSATNIISSGPGTNGPSLQAMFLALGNLVFTQAAAQGALPILYAATSPKVEPGGYYGPDGLGELWGSPAPAWRAPQARNREAASKLWRMSEELTAVSYGGLRRKKAPVARSGAAKTKSALRRKASQAQRRRPVVKEPGAR